MHPDMTLRHMRASDSSSGQRLTGRGRHREVGKLLRERPHRRRVTLGMRPSARTEFMRISRCCYRKLAVSACRWLVTCGLSSVHARPIHAEPQQSGVAGPFRCSDAVMSVTAV